MTLSDHKSALPSKKHANGIRCVLVQAFSCPNKECLFWGKIGFDPPIASFSTITFHAYGRAMP